MPSGVASSAARKNDDIKVLSLTPGVGILLALVIFMLEFIKAHRLVKVCDDVAQEPRINTQDEYRQRRRTPAKLVRRERRQSYVVHDSDEGLILEMNSVVESTHSSWSHVSNELEDKRTKSYACRSCGGTDIITAADWPAEAEDARNSIGDSTETISNPDDEPVFKLNKHVTGLLQKEIQELRSELRKRKLENKLLKETIELGSSNGGVNHLNNDIEEILNCNL